MFNGDFPANPDGSAFEAPPLESTSKAKFCVAGYGTYSHQTLQMSH